jgi:hypothetical protein
VLDILGLRDFPSFPGAQMESARPADDMVYSLSTVKSIDRCSSVKSVLSQLQYY